MQLSQLLSLLPLAGLALADTVATAAQAAPAANKMSMVAFGIGTNNFTRSYDFYTKIIGLTDTGISIPTDMFDETILTAPSGSGFLLMQFKPRREVTNLPIKIVLGVPDVPATIKKIKDAGYKIVKEPDPYLQLAFAEDPDGYLLEFNPS